MLICCKHLDFNCIFKHFYFRIRRDTNLKKKYRKVENLESRSCNLVLSIPCIQTRAAVSYIFTKKDIYGSSSDILHL